MFYGLVGTAFGIGALLFVMADTMGARPHSAVATRDGVYAPSTPRVPSVAAARGNAVRLNPACTPYVTKWDGVIFWGGCPSNQCVAGDSCQLDDSGAKWTCKCPTGPQWVLCEGKVTVDDDGVAANPSCSNKNCPASCHVADFTTRTQGESRFVCDCY